MNERAPQTRFVSVSETETDKRNQKSWERSFKTKQKNEEVTPQIKFAVNSRCDAKRHKSLCFDALWPPVLAFKHKHSSNKNNNIHSVNVLIVAELQRSSRGLNSIICLNQSYWFAILELSIASLYYTEVCVIVIDLPFEVRHTKAFVQVKQSFATFLRASTDASISILVR